MKNTHQIFKFLILQVKPDRIFMALSTLNNFDYEQSIFLYKDGNSNINYSKMQKSKIVLLYCIQ